MCVLWGTVQPSNRQGGDRSRRLLGAPGVPWDPGSSSLQKPALSATPQPSHRNAGVTSAGTWEGATLLRPGREMSHFLDVPFPQVPRGHLCHLCPAPGAPMETHLLIHATGVESLGSATHRAAPRPLRVKAHSHPEEHRAWGQMQVALPPHWTRRAGDPAKPGDVLWLL